MTTTQEKFVAFKKSQDQNARNIIQNILPKKIKLLHKKTKELMVDIPKFEPSPISDETNTECNEKVLNLSHFIQQEVQEYRSLLSSLQLWISFHIPKMEEEDHKRTDKISDILTLITIELLGCNGYLSQYLNYYLARAKLLLLHEQYPFIHGFIKTKDILDLKFYRSYVNCVREIRNSYCVLYENLINNYDNVITPQHPRDWTTLY